MLRSNGVLLPIFSLPGPFGIGCFGPEAVSFARQLKDAGVSWWQVLPFNPTSAGDSPYQCLSAYAGNPYFIDLRQLVEQALLTEDECTAQYYQGAAEQIDYGWLYQERIKTLRLAFNRLKAAQWRAIESFAQKQDWLEDYSLFSCIKQHFDSRPWWEWPDDGLRLRQTHALNDFAARNEEELHFVWFIQYEFTRQWQNLKKEIHELGVHIIGDMPIYVAADSAEVWSSPHYFEMDENRQFTRVAGVPPDYFSSDGQLWGNPLYRWDRLEEDRYAWWIKRIQAALEIYDLVRIDHFRGFESYWAVPAGEKTARNGVWEKGPAMKLFRYILDAFPSAPIIAEDLGDINNDVRLFLQETGLPGMKVLQFAFDPYFDSTDRPHSFVRQCVAYTGTHDNNTLCGWLEQTEDAEWELVRDYFGLKDEHKTVKGPESPACRSAIRTLWQSVADLVVAPLQDLLGLGSEGRINTPGTIEGNWRFRVTQEQLDRLDSEWLAALNRVCQR